MCASLTDIVDCEFRPPGGVSRMSLSIRTSPIAPGLPLLQWLAEDDDVSFPGDAPLIAGHDAAALFGHPGKLTSYLALVHPDDRLAVADPSRDDTGAYALEYRIRSADGTYLPVVEYGTCQPRGTTVVRHAVLANAPSPSALHGHDARQDALTRLSIHPAFVHGDFDEAAQELVRTVSKVLEIERVSLWLFENEPVRLRCTWLHELSLGTSRGTTELLAADFPLYFQSLLSGRALAADDARRDPRTSELGDGYLEATGITSMLDAPIRVGGEVVGVVCHEHVGPVRRWRAEEMAFAADAADQVAQLLLSARSRETDERNKALEARLARSERLEAVGRLAGGVAHDFNNVLFCMLTNVEFARSELGEGHPAHVYLSEAEISGWRAADLVRRLLAFSRRQVLQPTLVDLHLLVHELGQMLRRLVPENIELVFRRGVGAGLVKGDRAQLEQVVVNLVVNAGHALGRSGRIEIVTRAEGGRLLLEVSDTGPGVPPALRERIFEPFFTTRGTEGGTGLGLSTVFGVVRQHQGDVEVLDGPGGGALFRVWLPAVEADLKQPLPERTPAPEPPRTSATVLVAEDEELVRTATRRLLERDGYRVLEARDGEEATRLFESADPKPAVVVLDAVMPRMGGRETYDAIRATGARPSFLLVTGYDPDESLADAEDVEVMNKPYGTHDLLRAVRRLAAA